MPEPITMIIIGGALLATLMLWAWAYIRAFFTDHVVPFVRRQLGETVGNSLAELIYWIDNPVSLVRGKVKQLYRAFKRHLLGIDTNYKRVSSETVRETTETYLLNETGQVVKQTVEREVPWENLPAEIRRKMIEQGVNSAALDIKATFENKLRQTAEDQGMTLEDIN